MIKNNVYYEFFASYTVPNSNEVGYWIDLGANSKGKIIKVYNPNTKQWVKLTDATSDDAVSPFIGSNGNWWVDNRDTGVPASGNNPYIGDNGNWYLYDPLHHKYVDSGIIAYGKTAYDFAIESGFVGTEEEFKQQLIESVNAASVANEALNNATEMIENPPKIINGRWWFYDVTEDIYKDTGINAVGDAFTIVKTYPSIADMEDDYNGTEVRTGQFVMIDTGDVNNEEDSRLYLKGDTEWKFISDLSGAQGIQGLSAYQVAVQNGFIGTETDWLQSLKQPALDAANEANTAKEQVLALATDITNAEATRNTNENTRINAERTRVSSENVRVSNEADRQANETIRETQEASRKNDTAAAINAVNQAKTATEAATVNAVNATNNANTQADRAKEYADNPPKIQSGYWYTYDDTSSDYASTNVKATGNDGVSATVTVGTVTTLPSNDSATVTNTGTSTAAVLNFGIPKGNSGVESFDLTKYINADYTVKEGTLTDTEYQKFSDAYASNINVGVITIDNGDAFTVLLNWQVYDSTDSSYFYCYFYGAYSAIEDTGTRYGAIIINKSTKAYSSLMNPYSFVLVGQGPNGPQLPDMDLTNDKVTKADIEQVLIGNITTHHHDSFYISKTNGTAYTPTTDYNPATKKYVDDAVAAINVGQDGTTVNKEYVDQQLTLKVDKVAGKQLSTNDYTTAEKNKLSGIAAGAEVNVNADWNATSGDAQILNKPTLSTVAISNSYNDLDNKPTIITEEQVDQKIVNAIGSVYKVKGSVANYAALPTTDVAIGDVYNLTDTGANYVATSTTPTWDKLSETVDLSRYLTKTEASSTYQPIGNYLSTIPSEYITDSELNAKGYATTSSVTASINGVNQSIEEVDNKFGDYTTTTDMNTAINNAVSGKLDASAYTATDVLSKVREAQSNGDKLNADYLEGLRANSFALKTDIPQPTQAQQIAILNALNAKTWSNDQYQVVTAEEYNAIKNAIPSTFSIETWNKLQYDETMYLTMKNNFIASAYFKYDAEGNYEFYAYRGFNDAYAAITDAEPSITCIHITINAADSETANHVGFFKNYSISLKRSGTGSTYLADNGQYLTPSAKDVMLGNITTADSLSSLSISNYSIKVSLTSASTLSFATTPYEGWECMIDIKNTGASAIEQTMPTGTGWQYNVNSITIAPGMIGSISVRYIHETYLVTAVGS